MVQLAAQAAQAFCFLCLSFGKTEFSREDVSCCCMKVILRVLRKTSLVTQPGSDSGSYIKASSIVSVDLAGAGKYAEAQ